MSDAPDLQETMKKLEHLYKTASIIETSLHGEPVLVRAEFATISCDDLYDAITLLKAQQFTDLELAIRILALEEAEPSEDVEGWIEHFNGWFPGAATEKHDGDCTNMCHTCSRCVYEETMKRVPKYRQVLGLPSPPQEQHHEL